MIGSQSVAQVQYMFNLKKRNESDKNTNLLMKNNKKQMAKQYMQI